jgi:hypothetical protein
VTFVSASEASAAEASWVRRDYFALQGMRKFTGKSEFDDDDTAPVEKSSSSSASAAPSATATVSASASAASAGDNDSDSEVAAAVAQLTVTESSSAASAGKASSASKKKPDASANKPAAAAGEEDVWRRYFLAPMETTTARVLWTEKANGEAAHISAVDIGGQRYLLTGSKVSERVFVVLCLCIYTCLCAKFSCSRVQIYSRDNLSRVVSFSWGSVQSSHLFVGFLLGFCA